MAWFRNHYHCDRCGTDWDDEWSCCCDDECPGCGSRNWSPTDSDDLTFVIEQEQDHFVVLMSPKSAEHDADYGEVAVALSRDGANAYVAARQASYWD